LSQYDMTFIPQKAIKCHTLVDFLTARPLPKTLKLHEDIPIEFIEDNMTTNDEV